MNDHAAEPYVANTRIMASNKLQFLLWFRSQAKTGTRPVLPPDFRSPDKSQPLHLLSGRLSVHAISINMLDISAHDASSLPLALRAHLSGFYVTHGATMPDATTGLIYSPVFAIVFCLAFSDRHCLSLGYDFSLLWLRMFSGNCLKPLESFHTLFFRPVNMLCQRPRIKRACVDCASRNGLQTRFLVELLNMDSKSREDQTDYRLSNIRLNHA